MPSSKKSSPHRGSKKKSSSALHGLSPVVEHHDEVGEADISFESDAGVVAGGERSYAHNQDRGRRRGGGTSCDNYDDDDDEYVVLADEHMHRQRRRDSEKKLRGIQARARDHFQRNSDDDNADGTAINYIRQVSAPLPFPPRDGNSSSDNVGERAGSSGSSWQVGRVPTMQQNNNIPDDANSSTNGSNILTGGYNIANDTTISSSSSPGSSTVASSLMPLPGFEEADLLKRAIERRTLLHNRIAAMEAAKADLLDDGNNSHGGMAGDVGGGGGEDGSRIPTRRKNSFPPPPPPKRKNSREHPQQQLRSVPSESGYRSTSMRHPPPRRSSSHDSSSAASSNDDENNFDDHDDGEMEGDRGGDRHNNSNETTTTSKPPSKVRMSEHHRRMNELSERIKREAMEFMNFESSYADTDGGDENDERGMADGCAVGEHTPSGRPTSFSSGTPSSARKDPILIPTKLDDGNGVVEDDSITIKSNEILLNGDFCTEELFQECIQEEEEGDLDTLSDNDEAYESASESHHDRGCGGELDGSGGGGLHLREGEVRLTPTPSKLLMGHHHGEGGQFSTTVLQQEQPDSTTASFEKGGRDGDDEGSAEEQRRPYTEQQISRYSNMVRLGIPDVAVLRSMERDGILSTELHNQILSKLKEEHGVAAGSGESSSTTTERQSILTRSLARTNTHPGARSGGGNEGGDRYDGEQSSDRRLTLPLCEDPNYSKYFKMLKAKVPLSWVRRVLEVDGKDVRVLDLDPDKPLSEQIPAEVVDEVGNVNWDKVDTSRAVNNTLDAEAEALAGGGGAVATASEIKADTLANVKAELAVMTARASADANTKRRSHRPMPSDESCDESFTDEVVGESSIEPVAASSSSSSTADITAAAIAASNARMNRLRAIRNNAGVESHSSSEDMGRRRQSVDEIRRRVPTRPPPPSTSQSGRRTFPAATTARGANSSTTTTSPGSNDGSDAGSVTDLPLKDDPRFSKYFQMIRSRVPRSWVERVIEVDDRDPAILDLDPNKSLASQIGEEGAEEMLKGETDTLDSTDVSLEEDSTSARRSPTTLSPLGSPIEESEESLQQQLPEEGDAVGGDGSNEEDVMKTTRLPITQICDDINKLDEPSVTSDITTFRDVQEDKDDNATQPQEEEVSTEPTSGDRGDGIDLSKISSFLERIDAQVKGKSATNEAEEGRATSSRFTTTEEVENKLAELLENFDSRKAKEEEEEAQRQEMESNEQKQKQLTENLELVEKSQADIAKLSTLLATKIGRPEDGDSIGAKLASTQQLQGPTDEQSDLGNLPILLSQVLERMEQQQQSTDDQPEEEEGPNSQKRALEALVARRAALSERAASMEEEETKPKILSEDPEYSKYFKMLKLGLPRHAVVQALERDGKDVGIIDLDPARPLAEQRKDATDAVPDRNSALKALFSKRAAEVEEKEEAPDKNAALKALFAKRSADAAGSTEQEGTAPALKVDPEYKKYMQMLKIGMPAETVRQALERDGKDVAVADMDPEKSYASQVKTKKGEGKDSDPPLKDDPEYAKFFKMLKMRIPPGAVRQALQKEGKDPDIVDMDPERSYASQMKAKSSGVSGDGEKKPDIPPPAVQNALKKEGKDIEIINMDPDKSYSSQAKGNEEVGPPLKDDPEYAKFFKMLKIGIPPGAVQNAMKKEGKDTSIINMDPEQPLSQQQQSNSKDSQEKQPTKPKGPKVARKRLHWNKIDESKLNEKSFWNQAKGEGSSLQLKGLDIDNEEFASLFTSSVNKSAQPKKETAPEKKPKGKQKVQLIDGRRRMNGSILLTKFKVDYNVLAKQVDNMEMIEAEGNELRGMMQLLPTKDESLALRSYLPPPDAPQSEIDVSIAKLGECEQYMAVMLDVPDAKDKFQCMLFRAEFEGQADNIRDGTKMLTEACDSVRNSERFRKLLLYALKLGNALNTGGAANEEVTAITLDSLLKLAEAKAFDRQTSVLHYLVSIVQKNDEDVLKVSEDFVPVKAAERVAMDMLAQQLKEMDKGAQLVKDVVKRHLPSLIQFMRTDSVPTDEETPEDELLGASPMGRFSLSASSKIQSLSKEFNDAKSNFIDLLEFFGEDGTMTPEAFFCTINTFVSMFDQTHKELMRKQEARERKKRIDEKRKLREQEAAAKKIKSK